MHMFAARLRAGLSMRCRLGLLLNSKSLPLRILKSLAAGFVVRLGRTSADRFSQLKTGRQSETLAAIALPWCATTLACQRSVAAAMARLGPGDGDDATIDGEYCGWCLKAAPALEDSDKVGSVSRTIRRAANAFLSVFQTHVTFKKRFFVLDGNELRYYKDADRRVFSGLIDLSTVTDICWTERPGIPKGSIDLITDARVFTISPLHSAATAKKPDGVRSANLHSNVGSSQLGPAAQDTSAREWFVRLQTKLEASKRRGMLAKSLRGAVANKGKPFARVLFAHPAASLHASGFSDNLDSFAPLYLSHEFCRASCDSLHTGGVNTILAAGGGSLYSSLQGYLQLSPGVQAVLSSTQSSLTDEVVLQAVRNEISANHVNALVAAAHRLSLTDAAASLHGTDALWAHPLSDTEASVGRFVRRGSMVVATADFQRHLQAWLDTVHMKKDRPKSSARKHTPRVRTDVEDINKKGGVVAMHCRKRNRRRLRTVTRWEEMSGNLPRWALSTCDDHRMMHTPPFVAAVGLGPAQHGFVDPLEAFAQLQHEWMDNSSLAKATASAMIAAALRVNARHPHSNKKNGKSVKHRRHGKAEEDEEGDDDDEDTETSDSELEDLHAMHDVKRQQTNEDDDTSPVKQLLKDMKTNLCSYGATMNNGMYNNCNVSKAEAQMPAGRGRELALFMALSSKERLHLAALQAQHSFFCGRGWDVTFGHGGEPDINDALRQVQEGCHMVEQVRTSLIASQKQECHAAGGDDAAGVSAFLQTAARTSTLQISARTVVTRGVPSSGSLRCFGGLQEPVCNLPSRLHQFALRAERMARYSTTDKQPEWAKTGAGVPDPLINGLSEPATAQRLRDLFGALQSDDGTGLHAALLALPQPLSVCTAVPSIRTVPWDQATANRALDSCGTLEYSCDAGHSTDGKPSSVVAALVETLKCRAQQLPLGARCSPSNPVDRDQQSLASTKLLRALAVAGNAWTVPTSVQSMQLVLQTLVPFVHNCSGSLFGFQSQDVINGFEDPRLTYRLPWEHTLEPSSTSVVAPATVSLDPFGDPRLDEDDLHERALSFFKMHVVPAGAVLYRAEEPFGEHPSTLFGSRPLLGDRRSLYVVLHGRVRIHTAPLAVNTSTTAAGTRGWRSLKRFITTQAMLKKSKHTLPETQLPEEFDAAAPSAAQCMGMTAGISVGHDPLDDASIWVEVNAVAAPLILGATTMLTGRSHRSTVLVAESSIILELRPLQFAQLCRSVPTCGTSLLSIASAGEPERLLACVPCLVAALADCSSKGVMGRERHQVVTALASICRPIFLSVGEPLYQEGDFGDSAYIVISGEVAVSLYSAQSGSHVLLGKYTRNSCVGESSLILPGPRTTKAVALSSSLLLRITHASFRAVLAVKPRMWRTVRNAVIWREPSQLARLPLLASLIGGEAEARKLMPLTDLFRPIVMGAAEGWAESAVLSEPVDHSCATGSVHRLSGEQLDSLLILVYGNATVLPVDLTADMNWQPPRPSRDHLIDKHTSVGTQSIVPGDWVGGSTLYRSTHGSEHAAIVPATDSSLDASPAVVFLALSRGVLNAFVSALTDGAQRLKAWRDGSSNTSGNVQLPDRPIPAPKADGARVQGTGQQRSHLPASAYTAPSMRIFDAAIGNPMHQRGQR
jgi:CRP-like cAMP-binding protein